MVPLGRSRSVRRPGLAPGSSPVRVGRAPRAPGLSHAHATASSPVSAGDGSNDAGHEARGAASGFRRESGQGIDEALTTANSLNALNDSLGRIVGPAVGAWVLVQYGFAATLVACALLYLAGWTLLIGLRDQRQHAPNPSVPGMPALVGSFWASFVEGLRVVRARTSLVLAVAIFGLYMVADVPLSAILSAFMIDSVGVSPEVFGTLMSVRGVTGLLGGLLVVFLSRRVHEARLLIGGLLLYGASILTMGVANSVIVAVLVLIPIGPAAAAIQTGLFTMLQKESPPGMRGRVFALTGTVNGLITLVASIEAGGLGETFGTRIVVIASGCLHILPLLLTVTLIRAGGPSGRRAGNREGA